MIWPTLTTDRLTLLDDFPVFDTYVRSDRSQYVGAPVGRTQLRHPTDLGEPELGWAVHESFEIWGFAYEAVLAVRDYAYRALGLAPLMSLIAPENARSIALAEKLGCTPESSKTYPSEATVTVYRNTKVGK